MKLNVKPSVPQVTTHEGSRAFALGPEVELQRSVCACLLWEDSFYESGEEASNRIKRLIAQCRPEFVSGLAVAARENMKLRHVPLLLVREMARLDSHKHLVAVTLERVVQRADELTEFLAIYWKEKRQPLSAQVKKGLAKAFRKFGEYQLAKYNSDGPVKLRDVLFLSHSKPIDATVKYTKVERKAAASGSSTVDWTLAAHEQLYANVVAGTLATPDTWEVELSASKDKLSSWVRLLMEKRLGGLAFLRNLRNMAEAGVPRDVIDAYMDGADFGRVLPFRFIAAAKAAPQWEDVIEKGMLRSLAATAKLPGKTVLVIDTSGSMKHPLAGKSDMLRIDAAASLAILARELCVEPVIYCTAGNDSSRIHATTLIPPRRGFALSSLIAGNELRYKIGGGGIFLVQCLKYIRNEVGSADRVIVFTDEQDCDIKANPKNADAFGTHNYIVNIAGYKHGVGYGKFVHIDGWSEAILDYIRTYEGLAQ